MRPQGASSRRSRGACAEGAVIRMKTAAPRRVSTPPATRAPWGWALTGALLGLLLVGVLAAPARWLSAGVARATGDMVQLAEPQGSLWNGSARLLLTGGAGSQDRAALPGRVQWRLRPALGGLNLAMTADCCTPTGPLALRVSPRWGGARVAVIAGLSSTALATRSSVSARARASESASVRACSARVTASAASIWGAKSARRAASSASR